MVKSNVNCSIESEMKQSAINLNFSMSDCLAFGIRFRAAELNDSDYPGNLLSHKLERLAGSLEEANRRIEELEADKIGGGDPTKGFVSYPEGYYGN